MFTRSVRYYDALYSFKDYGVAAAELHQLIQRQNHDAESLLDVACGTGKHLESLSAHYEAEGLDLNKEMLAVARRRCPGLKFHCADMADFHLGRRFDVVTCLFSSIAYVKTVERLRRALHCMARHLRPGGLLIVEPYFTPEQYFVNDLRANFVDEPDLKIAWMYVSRKKRNLSILDIDYLVGTPEGIARFHERHELGLFTVKQYEAAFTEAGLQLCHQRDGLFGRGIYIGRTAESAKARG